MLITPTILISAEDQMPEFGKQVVFRMRNLNDWTIGQHSRNLPGHFVYEAVTMLGEASMTKGNYLWRYVPENANDVIAEGRQMGLNMNLTAQVDTSAHGREPKLFYVYRMEFKVKLDKDKRNEMLVWYLTRRFHCEWKDLPNNEYVVCVYCVGEAQAAIALEMISDID